MLNLLRQRNFALLWWGGLISFMGDWVLFVALPLHVYTLTGSVLATGAIFLVGRLPSVFLGSVAGVYVDRWDRKWTMVASNLLLGPLLLLMLFLQSASQVWIVYLVVLFTNTIRQFSGPSEDSLLPQLVGEENLVQANSLNALNNNLARLIGPAVGGVVFATYGFSVTVLLDMASFMIAGSMVAFINAPSTVTRVQRVVAEGEEAPRPHMLRELRAGLSIVKNNRVISALFIILGINMLAEGILSTLIVVWVQEFLRGGSQELGWLLTGQAVGGVLGGVLMGRMSKVIKPWQFVVISFLVVGVLDFVIFNTPILLVGVVLMAIIGVPVVGLQAGAMTLFQTNVANEYRGRVLGAFGTTSALVYLVGILLASAFGNGSNVVFFLSLAAVFDFIAGIVAFFLLREARQEIAPRSSIELIANTTAD